tara:strand:+ start:96207 stop:96698 length:492 start_codon:yes stop_codon:yes gene_type:complete
MPFPPNLSLESLKNLTSNGANELSGLHMRCFQGNEVWSPQEFLDVSSDPVRWGVYAEIEEEGPIGVAVMLDTGDDSELLTIAVHPAYRAIGIGRYLLQFVEETAIGRGRSRILLDVAADNPDAIGLYTSEGYGRSGSRKAYYDRGDGLKIDAIQMTKPITEVR